MKAELIRLLRSDETEAEFQRHLELEPLSVSGITNLGLVRFCKKDYAGAEPEHFRALEIYERSGAERWRLSRNM